jgi:uncharacterized protein (DUF885 family)
VWRLPDGKAYYEALLANYTTTDMTATQIHDLGLSEVARIHGEMKAIMAKVGFKGTLQQFFEHLRTSPQYYHTTREAYLAEVDARTKAMEARLPAFFNTLPKAALQVKGGRGVPREVGRQGLLPVTLARRIASRHLLCEPL